MGVSLAEGTLRSPCWEKSSCRGVHSWPSAADMIMMSMLRMFCGAAKPPCSVDVSMRRVSLVTQSPALFEIQDPASQSQSHRWRLAMPGLSGFGSPCPWLLARSFPGSTLCTRFARRSRGRVRSLVGGPGPVRPELGNKACCVNGPPPTLSGKGRGFRLGKAPGGREGRGARGQARA